MTGVQLVLVAVAVVLCAQAPVVSQLAYAQEPQAQVEQPTLQQRAQSVRQLIAGDLPVDVAPEALFTHAPDGQDLASARLVLVLLNDANALAAARKSGEVGGYTRDAVELAVAQADFLLLKPAKRESLLKDHADKVANASAEQAKANDDQRLLDDLQREGDALEAFLTGLKTDLSFLDIDLLDPSGIALNADRRASVLENAAPTLEEPAVNDSPVAPAAVTEDPVEPPMADKLVAARARVDVLRARLLALTPEEIGALIEAQSKERSDIATVSEAEAAADRAAEQAAEAAVEALRAATESQRLIAHERSRLLEVREVQARFEATLAGRGDPTTALDEETLRWRREIRELQSRSRLNATRELDANTLYAELVESLKDVRRRLSGSLAGAGTGDAPALDPPAIDAGVRDSDPGALDVRRLREELITSAARLRALDTDHRMQEREALYAAMVDLNAARLSLIPDLAPRMRSEIVGFGESGIAQVGRELNQIALIGRYNLASLPSIASETLGALTSPTPDLIIALLQVAVVALMFRFWRQNGDAPIARIQMRQAARQPQTIWSAYFASTLGYYRDVRRPVEWLALALGVRWLLAGKLTFFGEQLIWTVVIWLLVAATLVQMANRLSHGPRGKDQWAEVRLKSLKLLAAVFAGVGLLLSITSDLVGQGAIHNWALSACWLVAPVLVLVLAYWWRERITTLAAKSTGSNPILKWAAGRHKGVAGHASRVLAGAVLLSQGVVGVVRRRLNDIAIVRDIADQRRRKQAAEQAAADEASGQYAKISEEQSAALEPHRRPMSDAPEARSPTDWDPPELAPGKLIAVVGERGLGKSTALRDIVRGCEQDRVVRVNFSGGGYQSLLDTLASALGVDGDEKAISDAIASTQPSAIVIDDFQRIFVPAIGGLRDFDQFITFARNMPSETAWLFAIGGPAMTYISRARSDRAMFDETWFLPRWSAKDLRALIERRTEQAGIVPHFDLAGDAALSMFDNDQTPDERARQSYFARLKDLSDGNPAIALDIWRRSLFVNLFTNHVEVRTFSAPPAEDLLDLPEATLFVLRAMMQMEVANPETIRRCTDLDAGVVAEAVRRLSRLGVISPLRGGYRVSLYWYREAGRILERQNLMVRAAA